MKRWHAVLPLALVAILGVTFAIRDALGQGSIENIQNQLQGLDQKEALIRKEEDRWRKDLQDDNGRMWLANNSLGGSPEDVQRDIDYDNARIAEYEQQLAHIKDQRAALNQELTDERLRRQGGGGANAIQVTAGTYGGNCPADAFSTGRGNVTPQLSEACDGKDTCSYTVDYNVLGDPSVGCAKTYVAEWTCGDSGRLHRIELPGEAGYGSVAHLTCGSSPAGDDVQAGGDQDGSADGPRSSTVEGGQNRQGSDYTHYAMSSADPSDCETHCVQDGRCKAWTYVKPGVQGDSAMCWLKDSVPDLSVNDCCTSGMIQTQQ